MPLTHVVAPLMKKLALAVGFFLLAGCALSEDGRAVVPSASTSSDARFDTKQVKESSLSGELMYRVLAAETLVFRHQVPTAAQIYLDLAVANDNPQLAQRAYDLATQSGNRELLMRATVLNTAKNPSFIESWQVQVIIHLREGRIDEALSAWDVYYQQSQSNGVSQKEVFLSTASLAQDAIAPGVLLAFSQAITEKYPSAFAEFVHAMFLSAIESNVAAFDRVMKANERYPFQPELAQLTASLAIKLANGRGLEWLESYVKQSPDDAVVWEQLARLYVSLRDLSKAKQHYQALVSRHAQVASAVVSLGLLSIELKDYAEAEVRLMSLMHDRRYSDMARYYLGQVYYFQNKLPEAMTMWKEVKHGEYRVDAVIWQAQLMMQSGKVADAKALLTSFEGVDESESLRLWRAKARLWVTQQQPAEALKILDEAIMAIPDEGELWQDRANIKYDLNDGAGFETDMKQAIRLSPNDPDMLNALGYFYVDAGKNLSEARALIEKANSLSPNKHYITDSLGWLAYREGRLDQAEKLLSQAYDFKADEEILRHWLEVLLAMGKKQQAKALAEKEAARFSEDPLLKEFLKQKSLLP